MSVSASFDVNDLKIIFLIFVFVVGLYLVCKNEVAVEKKQRSSVTSKNGNYKITINGVTYTGKGNNVSVINNKVYVDGAEIKPK